MSYDKQTWQTGDVIAANKLNHVESGVRGINAEYTPTTWANGDTITASKLNNIEDGIANASGGGGSTAHVEFICTFGGYDCYTPIVQDGRIVTNYQVLGLSNPPFENVDIPLGENGTLLPLSMFANIDLEVPPTLTGDIVFDVENDGFLITGDGTITLKGFLYG